MPCFAGVAMAAVLLCGGATSSDAEVPAAAAGDFVGSWTLSMSFGGQEVEMALDLLEADGLLAATLSSELRSEPQEIADLTQEGDVLTLKWLTTVQGQETNLQMMLRSVDGELEGSLGDVDGFFSTEIRGWQGDRAPPVEGAAEGQVAQARSAPRGDSTTELVVADKKIRIRYAPLEASSPDYQRMVALEPGEVLGFEGGRAIKLLSEATLKFGDTLVPTGNVAAGYDGVYSLWLRKVSEGWELVFNREADIWGTQRLAKADVSSVPIDYRVVETGVEQFSIELIDTPSGGLLRIGWGTGEWAAPFEVTD